MQMRTFVFKSSLMVIALAALCWPLQGGTVKLAWEAAPGQVKGYNVYRSTGQQPFQVLNSQPLTSPIFEDRSAEVGTLYYYSVTSVAPNGQESDFSNRVAAKVGGQARLGLDVSPPRETLVGTRASFDVRVQNQGTAPNGSVLRIQFQLPAGMEWDGSSGGEWACSAVSSGVACASESIILPGASSRLALYLRPRPEAQAQSDLSVHLSTAQGVVISKHYPVGKILHGFYTPYQLAGSDGFVGVALANHSQQDAGLDVELFDQSGVRLVAEDDGIHLNPGAQHVELSYQRNAKSVSNSGWMAVVTENPGVGGFFQFGDRQLARLDGGRLCTVPQRELVFSRVFMGDAGLRGSPARSVFEIVNPGDRTAVLDAELVLTSVDPHQPAVSNIASRHTGRLVLGPKELLEVSPEELFGDGLEGVGYVRVRAVDGDGVVGFQRLDLGGGASTVGLSTEVAQARILYAPQVAYNRQVFTHLRLINTASQLRSLQLTLTGESGQTLFPGLALTLEAGAVIDATLDQLFELPPESDVSGSLEVKADGPGVTGNLILADPQQLAFAASLPLEAQTRTHLAFDYFASTKDFFTGLAVTNTASESAVITLEALDRDGLLVAAAELDLGPRHVLSRTLSELLPEVKGRIGGYIRIRSTQPVVAQQVFGDKRLDFMSVVPAQFVP